MSVRVPGGYNPASVAITGGSITGQSGTPYVLAQSFAPVSAPTDTTEDTLATIAVPANALGANGIVRLDFFVSGTASANNKTFRVRWSGGAGTALIALVETATPNAGFYLYIGNRGATNSQLITIQAVTTTHPLQISANAWQTASVDTTAATSIVITGQKATGSETLTLEGYIALLSKP